MRPPRHPARAADEQRLLARQPPRHVERVGVGDGHDLVGDLPVVGRRPEVLPDPLDEVGPPVAARVHRTDRVGADDVHPAVGDVLEVVAGARDRPAGADPRDEVRDSPVGLLPQLRAGADVRLRVGRVGVLVGLPAAVDLLDEPVGRAVVRLGTIRVDRGGADDDLGAVRPQRVLLGHAHLVRADEDAVVAAAAGR